MTKNCKVSSYNNSETVSSPVHLGEEEPLELTDQLNQTTIEKRIKCS